MQTPEKKFDLTDLQVPNAESFVARFVEHASIDRILRRLPLACCFRCQARRGLIRVDTLANGEIVASRLACHRHAREARASVVVSFVETAL